MWRFLLLLSGFLCFLSAEQAAAQNPWLTERVIIVDDALRGENSFTAIGSGQNTVDFRSWQEAASPGSGSLGFSDTGTIFNFNASGEAELVVKFQDIIGAAQAGQATVINLYDDSALRQNPGGTVTGQVELNFNGANFQTFEGFYNVGRADLDTRLVIGGTNAAPSPDGLSSTVVGIVNINGGRNGNVTAVIAGAAGEGPVDYLFNVASAVAGGAFAFYYNGSTAKQGNSLKIGAANEDTSVLLGGSNEQASVRLSDLIGGDNGHSTTMILDGQVKVTADTAQNTLNIINNNIASGAVILENVLDGVLNLGGTGSNVVLKWVNAANEGLRLNSLDNSNRRTVEAAALGHESGLSSAAKITLGNATLKLAEDGSGLNSLSNGSRLAMTSADGHSILDASQVNGDFRFGLSQQPTITVGGGGHVIVENNNLIYSSALESAANLTRAEDFGGQAAFERAGENRLIFLSHGQNSFEGGLAIDDSTARLEFAGSSFLNGFTGNGEGSRLNAGHIYFTGLNNSSDPLEASRVSFGNGFIDMGGSTLHLNNSLLVSPADGHIGGMGSIASLVMGDGAGIVDAGQPAAVTILEADLSAEQAAIGSRGAQINAAVAVGGHSSLENSLNISGTLEIGGQTIINGHLGTLANGESPAFYFTAKESIQLTDAATFSYIDPGTVFMIDLALAALLRDSGEGLLILDAAEGSAEISPALLASLAAGLVFSDANLGALAGYFSFDPFSGILGHGQPAANTRAVPAYARPMLKAAGGHNAILGQYIEQGPGLSDRRYYQEVAQIMGNTLNAALNMPHSSAGEALKRLRKMAALAPLPAEGNPAFRLTDGLWFSTLAGRLSIGENYREGFGGATANSTGLTLGYDLEAKRYLRAGFFAGVNVSGLKTEWQTIESEAVELGAYGQIGLPWSFLLNAALSYSWQSHSSSRDIDLRGSLGKEFRQNLQADFSGDSINVQTELKRSWAVGGRVTVTPSLAYIYQGTLLEPFMETSDKHDSPQFDLSTISGGADFNLHQVKAGAEILWPGETVSLNARAHYLRNLGDLRPEGQAAFVHSAAPQIFRAYGAKLDRQMLNLGLGLDWNPADSPFSIGLDYEGNLGNTAKSQTLNLNISYNF